MPQFVIQPPSNASDPRFYSWAKQLTDLANAGPQSSFFSASTPNSNITGSPGAIAINIGSGGSVFWIKQSGTTTSGWTAVA